MATGNIKIVEATDNYTRINRSLIFNLDYKVVGIYCKVMILGKKWDLNIKGLAEALKKMGQPISEKKIREAMSVLESAGYMMRKAVKDEEGKFRGWDYYFFSEPIAEEERSEAGKRTCPKTDLTENGQDRKRTTPETDMTGNGQEIIYRLNEYSDNNNIHTIREKRTSAFVKPSLDEVRQYFREKGTTIDPEAFYAYYESNGWMVGRTKMKSWKAALTTWEKREKKYPAKRERVSAQFDTKKEWEGWE